jgi:hypothetical protein
MSIVEDINTFIKKHVHLTDSFSPIYLAAWVLASYLPFPALPALYVEGSGRAELLTLLNYMCPEIILRRACKGLPVAPTILLDPPKVWTPSFFIVEAEATGIKPVYDRALHIGIGAWIREYGQGIQEIYWVLRGDTGPDALTALTAVLMCVGEEGEQP